MTAEEILREMEERLNAILSCSEYQSEEEASKIGLKLIAGYRELLALHPRRKRLTKNDEPIYQHAWVDGQTATLRDIRQITDKALGVGE